MTENTNKQLHPALQFIIFISLTIAVIGGGYLIGAAMVVGLYGVNILMDIARLNLNNPNAVNGLWVVQIVSTTIPILAASIIFARLVVKNQREYLKTSFNFPGLLLVIVFFVMLISSPLIEYLSNINQQLQLPHFLDGVQRWMRETEDEAQRLTAVLLQMKTIQSMIFKLLVVGLLTAIVEEFMFRGCMQTIFIKWTGNLHAAIWITAVLFSTFHMEFFGFLPRLLLGVLFGYFVAWSGSIWTSVWAHFLNNGTAVVVSYLYQNKMIKFNPDDQHVFNYAGYLFSLIIVLFLLYLYRYTVMAKEKAPVL
ncbi:CPBP family intramembrane glutamic endopeptidase [Mucilaginibacter sp. UR6-11]|uniref:CPBP family intramembrane glutamic endopeptidase n=1 Tax=Mucilaginibacter sp. UR6-11 TaxID=1435644 RepID=UPI001E4CB929|nr:CPBP family intramembrane glutamic endopeptidase [Mucilaginibacter sp. UR6-11]MCC8424410.1 CPBP family intramembrane metalloprotease [Mucilaginibacter sp. UR6-11]